MNVQVRQAGAYLLIALGAAAIGPPLCEAKDQGGDAIVPGTLDLYPTWTAVGIELPYQGDANGNAGASFVWRRAGEERWHDGVEVTVDRRRHFIWASIWPLAQGETIEVRVTLSDPEPLDNPIQATTTTLRMVRPEGGRTFYVSPKLGDDAKEGTRQAPWKTLGHARKMVRPGDVVYALSGVYAEGDLLGWLKGKPEKPILFAAAKGQRPVLDSSVEVAAGSGAWKQTGEEVYVADADFGKLNQGYVAQDGRRSYRYGSLDDLRKDGYQCGRAWFYDGGVKKLYVRTGSSEPPEKHTYNYSRHEYGFFLEGSKHIIISGFEIRNYASAAVRISSPAWGNIVYGNHIHNSANGIFIKSETTDHNAIWNNEIHEPGLEDFSWQAIKSSGYARQGVNVYQAGRGTSICRNRISGWFDGIVALSWKKPEALGLNRDMDVIQNEIWNIGDDALEMDGGGVNMRVSGNRIRNAHTAISLAPIERGPVYVTRNHASFRALMFKLNVGADSRGPAYCYHNSGYAMDDGNSASMISFGPAKYATVGKVFINNAMIGSEYSLRYGCSGNRLDYNCYFNTPATPFRKFVWNGKTYRDLGSFQRESGQEQHGMYADPQFTATPDLGRYPQGKHPHYKDTSVGNLRPSGGSPLIDAGAVIRGVNEGFAGDAPDIGAFEQGR